MGYVIPDAVKKLIVKHSEKPFNTIFLDIGMHDGQTLDEVTSEFYMFDRIYSFEPMKAQYDKTCQRFKNRPCKSQLILLNYGLADKTGSMMMYGSNEDMGATLYQRKKDLVGKRQEAICGFVKASEFFEKHIGENDIVIVKANCEGAECMILNDLLDSGQIRKVNNVMIDFDVRKIPGMEKEEDKLIERFKKEGFTNFSLCEKVMKGKTHQLKIRHWLSGLKDHRKFMKYHSPVKRFLIKKRYK